MRRREQHRVPADIGEPIGARAVRVDLQRAGGETLPGGDPPVGVEPVVFGRRASVRRVPRNASQVSESACGESAAHDDPLGVRDDPAGTGEVFRERPAQLRTTLRER